jgi:ADP-L-glycero-D-manno-heptose 6-epimerase
MIILTGAKGFIGVNFLVHLEQRGKTVIKIEENNYLNFRATFKKWDEVELILHQGAISSTVETNLKKIFSNNIEFSQWLFEKAAKYNIPVKYASSASVYGNEQGIINPLNYYALSKVTIDYWVQDNMDRFPLIQGFRYFNVYGTPEDNKGDQASPVSKFAKQVEETGKLELFEGSDKFLRDFIWVGDIIKIVLDNDKGSGIYDLGTSNPVSFQHVAECVAEHYFGKIEYIPFPEHLKSKYQTYTCAKKEWGDYKFKTIKEYLLE